MQKDESQAKLWSMELEIDLAALSGKILKALKDVNLHYNKINKRKIGFI